MQENTFSQISLKYENEISKMHEHFQETFSSSSSLSDISKYQVFSGGKHIRPLLIFIISNLFSNTISEDIINFATGIELLHNATLVHDDIIDNSEYRRKKLTVKNKYGSNKAILSGDYLFAFAFNFILNLPRELIIKTQQASVDLIEGEAKELECNLNDITAKDSLFIMSKKTASLFSLSTYGSFLLNNKNKENIGLELANDFEKLGFYIGMCFQIMDDILDITSDEKISGKKQGKDFLEKKPSIVVSSWLQKNTKLKSKYLEDNTNIAKIIDDIKKEVQDEGIISDIQEIFNTYFENSCQILKKISQNFSNNSSILDLKSYLEYIKNKIF